MIASRQLCKRLNKLTQWGDTMSRRPSDVALWWVKAEDVMSGIVIVDDGEWVVCPNILSFKPDAEYFPAYDLDYIMVKLTEMTTEYNIRLYYSQTQKFWHAKFDGLSFGSYDDRAVDAAAKLAISTIERLQDARNTRR